MDVMNKPRFNEDQMISASKAAKNFAKVRRNAKSSPQFVTQNDGIDSVIQSYEHYEKMYSELEDLREKLFDLNVSNRVQKADSNREDRVDIKDVMSEQGYAEFQKIDPNSISDEDLFE